MPVIEILGLEKTYATGLFRKQRKHALHAFTLEVYEGEVFGFLGPNGAGKTTTIKLLMGLVFPSAGSARNLGLSIGDPRVHAYLGFLPEQPYFYDHLTARELLEYYAQLSGMEAKGRARRICEVLQRVGLDGSAETALRKFSKGMLQRVGLAQAILHNPRVLFLDEPMSGLDPLGRRELRLLIEELKAEGKTVFFSTHLLADAEALCDRVAVLHAGRLRGVGAVCDLIGDAGRVELVWRGRNPVAMRPLLLETHISGELVRGVVPEAAQEEAMKILRCASLPLVSLTPVRTSLEEYYLRQTQSEAPPQEVRA